MTYALKKVWQVDDLCQGSPTPSTWSAPSVKGNRLVIPGRSGDSDVISCFNADTGTPIWKHEYSAPVRGWGVWVVSMRRHHRLVVRREHDDLVRVRALALAP